MSEAADLLNLFDYERLAAERLPQLAYDYFASGAHDELTLHANREAFERIALLPRVLVDVSERDSSVELLGRRHALPLVVAPMAFAKMADPAGEAAIARAAGAAGVTVTLSTLATTSIEDVAAAVSSIPPSPRSMRCPPSRRPSLVARRCWSTAACGAAPTS